MTAPRDKRHEESLTAALNDSGEAAAYLDAVIGREDPDAQVVALRQLAAANGAQPVGVPLPAGPGG